MITRLQRRNRTDIHFKEHGVITDLFDNAMKEVWRINDDEYDYLCEHTSDLNCPLFLDEKMSISQLKSKIKEVNSIIEEYYKLEKL